MKDLFTNRTIVLSRGNYITKKDATEGTIPVILGGQEPAYFIDHSNHTGKAVVVSRSGASAGFVSYWDEPIFVTDGFVFDCDETRMKYRFFYHWVKSLEPDLNQAKKGAGVPHISGEDLGNLPIPVPHLFVQEEISRKLDTFDELVNETLPAEIAARRRAAEAVREECFAALEKAG